MAKFYHFSRLFLTLFAVLAIDFCIAGVKPRFQKVKEFIPEGYELFDSASGDLNGDGLTDYAIILKGKVGKINTRPLLILMGTEKQTFNLIARNDSVVLCATCGGVFEDPYQGISIQNGFLSIEHLIGTNWRWTREICFKYDATIKDFVLHKDEGVSYNVSFPNRKTGIVNNREDFDKLPFAKYSYNKGY